MAHQIGDVIEVAHPFVRGVYESLDEDGPCDEKTWNPGVRFELIPPDDSEAIADAMGAQILTIIDIHKPGQFPTRIFYTRRWRRPDGREFGKGRLRIATAQQFQRIVQGYRYPYRVGP